MSRWRTMVSARLRHIWPPLVIPLLWLVVSESGAWWPRLTWLTATRAMLQEAENITIDYRFRFRGPIASPTKVVYLGMDERTITFFSKDLFPREAYAMAIDAAFAYGPARALMLDVILNRTVIQGGMIRTDAWMEDNFALVNALRSVDHGLPLGLRVVFAAKLPIGAEARAHSQPEIPLYPFWAPPGLASESPVQVGSINVVYPLRSDVPRFVPAYIDVPLDSLYREYFRGVAGWLEMVNPGSGARMLEHDGQLLITLGDGSQVTTARVPAGDVQMYPAAVQTLMALHADQWPSASVEGRRLVIRGFDEQGASIELYSIPVDRSGNIAINWFSPWINTRHNPAAADDSRLDPFTPKMSMFDLLTQVARISELRNVLENGDSADAQSRSALQAELAGLESGLHQFFKDAIVLIGPTDPVFQDVGPTPFEGGNIPRVSAHGNLIKMIADGRFIFEFEPWMRILAILGLAWLLWAVSALHARFSLLARIGAPLLLGSYLAAGFLLFRHTHVLLPLVVPLSAAASTGLVTLGLQVVAEERQKRRIQRLFGNYLAPDLVQQMVDSGEQPHLGGHTEDITAFFSDIQSFSSFSEVLDPAQLVDLMNEYLEEMTSILESAGGTLDKYIGDAMVGIFGAPLRLPDHARRACEAAARMQQAQLRMQQRWQAMGTQWPHLVHHMRTRIGLHSGPAIVGNMGSSKRFNYTMMGDTVNLAARNESAAKAFGVYTMVSGDTVARAVEQGAPLAFRLLDRIIVKGRTKPVDIYELCGFDAALSATDRNCLAVYGQGMAAYWQRDWHTAAARFAESAALECWQPERDPYVATNPSLVMQARVAVLRAAPPPADWDGCFTMTSK
jgi:adenylate cyclase